jgi:hypothetical protein
MKLLKEKASNGGSFGSSGSWREDKGHGHGKGSLLVVVVEVVVLVAFLAL